MHCFSKSLVVIRRYHHFTHRAANHCCQSLTGGLDREPAFSDLLNNVVDGFPVVDAEVPPYKCGISS